jgi:hypothetical protein
LLWKIEKEDWKLTANINASQLSMPLGVVLERRPSNNQWVEYDWSVDAVLPGASEIDDWVKLANGSDEKGDWVKFHAATLPLEIFRKETEGYKFNLTLEQPSVFIVLRSSDDEEEVEEECKYEVFPFLVTVCPYEAQDYLDSGEEVVDNVPMPLPVMAWLDEYISHHHVEEPFKKRKRKDFDPRKEGYDKPLPPISYKYDKPPS